jgi:uncharacterized protein
MLDPERVDSSKRHRSHLLLLSPWLVIAFAHVTARLAGGVLGVWAWAPTLLLFWSLIAALIIWSGGNAPTRRWLQPSQGSWRWALLAMGVALIPLPLLVLNWPLLGSPLVFLLWLAFGFLNPWFEEAYWRGALLDAASHWHSWAAVGYTSALFAASHPLIWGVHSIANGTIEVVVSTFVMGVVWSIIYKKTRSLRWAIASHVLVDLFGLSIPVFLNLYVPRA